MNRPRASIFISMLLIVLLIGTLWSYSVFSSARAGAANAADDEADCLRLAGQIRALREKPALAGVRELRVNELTARVESAAGAAKCPDNSLIRIDPEPARRLNDSPY